MVADTLLFLIPHPVAPGALEPPFAELTTGRSGNYIMLNGGIF